MIQNKHIIRLSFIALFINIVANIVLYRYFMIEEVILNEVSKQSGYIADSFKEKVWESNRVGVLKIMPGNIYDLLQDDDVIKLLSDIRDFISSTKANITLYDAVGNKIISSEDKEYSIFEKYKSTNIYNNILIYMDRYFLSKFMNDQGLAHAYRGKSNHNLVSRAIVNIGVNYNEEVSYVKSYIPIIGPQGKFKISGVIEITSDITKEWDNITLLEQKIFLGFIVIFLFFFGIIMYNTNYAQRIINKQYETNRDLKAAKMYAETESLAKTEFLANMSHELRTPLNAIIGFSEIMIMKTYGEIENKQYREYVQDISNSGKHLLTIINDILDFSKASANKLLINNVEIDLNKLASSSMRFVKPKADQAKIKLIEDFPDETVVIRADPKRLKQALLNLLSNSVKFTPASGTITLSVKKDYIKKQVYIVVADTGIGMSEQEIPKALSLFGQVDNSLSRKYDGTGLGLPLTKKLVELMDGEFDIQSKPGNGTKVTIIFNYSDYENA